MLYGMVHDVFHDNVVKDHIKSILNKKNSGVR